MPPLTDHKDHVAVVYDNGLFPELAVVLARSFGTVEYYSHWKSAEPKNNAMKVGQGLEGVKRINNFWTSLKQHPKEKVLVVFPDIYDGDLQWELQSQGYRVWGSRNGEQLEIHRVPAKKEMQSKGISVGPYTTVNGTDELRKALKEKPKVHVKTSRTRGDMETFFAKDYLTVEPRIDQLDYMLGVDSKTKEFIIEDTIDPAVEIGWDGYSIDGRFPNASLVGIEAKSQGYVGHFLREADQPKQVVDINQKIAQRLAYFQYRNFFTIEARIKPDGSAWAIDPCCRMGSPPGELVMEFYTNLPDIMWHGAAGQVVNPIPIAEWGAEIVIHSDWANDNWQPIRFGKGLRRFVKIKNATRVEGVYYAVPQLDKRGTIASVIGFGNTAESAVESAKAHAKGVEGYGLEIPVESLDKCLKEIATLKSYGVSL